MIEQVENSNLVKLSYKYSPRKGLSASNVLLIFFAVTVVAGAVILSAVLSNFINNLDTVDLAVADSEDTLQTAYWTVTNIKQNAEAPNTYDLDLDSSIGNLRSYTSIRSFGLSSDRARLATIKGDNFEIIDLATDTTTTAALPASFSGDKADTISWSFDDKYFALSVVNKEDDSTHILILTNTGELHQDISANLASQTIAGEKVPYPVLFSPKGYYLLTRGYEPDAAVADINQKPVTLMIYKIDGRNIWEETIRGSASDGSGILYGWSSDGKAVRYATIPASKPINYADQFLFTQIAVDFGG